MPLIQNDLQAFYLVKWLGLDYKEATWEDKTLLKQIPSFAEELERFRGRKRDVRPVRVSALYFLSTGEEDFWL